MASIHGFHPRQRLRATPPPRHAAAITLAEFPGAAGDHPIVFDGRYSTGGPWVLFSRTEGTNPHMGADGSWAPGVYLPDRIRCHPLVPGAAEGDTLLDADALIDDAAAGIALCNAAGGWSDAVRERAARLERWRRMRPITGRLEATLETLDLLVPHDLEIACADGWCYRSASLRVVAPDRLRRLGRPARARLCREGLMEALEAHVRSLDGLGRLPAPRDALAAHDESGHARSAEPPVTPATTVAATGGAMPR